jgi:hypothetical protein
MKADPTAPITVPRMGMGFWTRANTEHCLLATRGHPKRLHADVRQGIIELPRQHSRKPDCIYERIERLVAGPYCELFARQARPGWDSFGDQVTQFAEPVPASPARRHRAQTPPVVRADPRQLDLFDDTAYRRAHYGYGRDD